MHKHTSMVRWNLTESTKKKKKIVVPTENRTYHKAITSERETSAHTWETVTRTQGEKRNTHDKLNSKRVPHKCCTECLVVRSLTHNPIRSKHK